MDLTVAIEIGLGFAAFFFIKKMIDVNTIVGNPVTTPDGTTIIPVSKVAFGFGAGGTQFAAKSESVTPQNPMFGGGCGGGAKEEDTTTENTETTE